MKVSFGSCYRLPMICLLLGVIMSACTTSSAVPPTLASNAVPSMADFDRRARAGERLNVAFFGGSLTWGANASDPTLYSYRVLMINKLEEQYPKAHFKCLDAAIGGTGSQLGVFRLERDVLARHPDLVFLEFTINDGPYNLSAERLASYEALVRRLTAAKIPVVSVRLPVWQDFQAKPAPRPMDAEHEKIARYYNLPIADVVAAMRVVAKTDPTLPDQWWPTNDKTHPGDPGYAAYADGIWSAYLQSVKQGIQPHLPPTMLHDATYMTTNRVRLSKLAPLPAGWTVGKPTRLGVAFDFTMSRWLDDEVIVAPNAASWKLTVHGSVIMLYGESNPKSGKMQVLIDGKPTAGRPDGVFNFKLSPDGNMRWIETLAEGLDPKVAHTVELIPQVAAGEEIRIESLCIAGGAAKVEP